MAYSMKSHTGIRCFIFLLLFVTGCSTQAPVLKVTTSPMKIETVIEAFTPRPTITISATKTVTPSSPKATPTATITITPIPPTETLASLPQLDFITEPSAFPAGQYLIYWSFVDPYCGLKAVSTTKKVYEIINLGCHGTTDDYNYKLQQNAVLSENALYLLIPQGKERFLYHMMDNQQEQLTSSKRDDCVITSVASDGKKFAGKCGGFDFGRPSLLAVRTIDSDWAIIEPLEPSESNDVLFTVAWSPDGNKLAFVNVDYPQNGVFVINDVDQCLKNPQNCASLVTGPYWKNITDYITWSPDGKQIAVTLSCATIIYNIKTKQSRTIIDYESKNLWLHGAAFSPDGKWIGYSREQEPNMESTESNAYLVSLVDGTTFMLTGKDVHQVVGWLNIGPN